MLSIQENLLGAAQVKWELHTHVRARRQRPSQFSEMIIETIPSKLPCQFWLLLHRLPLKEIMLTLCRR